jgi:hypothetical protein
MWIISFAAVFFFKGVEVNMFFSWQWASWVTVYLCRCCCLSGCFHAGLESISYAIAVVYQKPDNWLFNGTIVIGNFYDTPIGLNHAFYNGLPLSPLDNCAVLFYLGSDTMKNRHSQSTANVNS